MENNFWASNTKTEPFTRERMEAAIEQMKNSPVRMEPDMEYFKCKNYEVCPTHGQKMMGMKMVCPRCGGEVWDIASVWKESNGS